ncbi:hypothetical protein BH09BAC5_BH09BAC5_01360 [soil metagenome]
MLFARIKAIWLFLIFFVPIIISVALTMSADFYPAKHLRFLTISLNLSTVFAILFVAWILTLVFILAPSFRSRFLVFFGMAISVLFRMWQDSFTLEALNVTGKLPKLEFISIDSPVFVMHVLVSLFMIYVLVLLSIWLIKKEISLGLTTDSKAKTILSFIVFPIGIFFIQPRMRKILGVKHID